MLQDTIVALAGYQTQAIAIVRISGDEAKDIAGTILEKSIRKQPANTIKHNWVVDGKRIIDEVMVSCFRAPNSYTGQDMVEINIHGSRYLGARIISLLVKGKARLALPGEFTLRAYLNGKINLSQAEAIDDLVKANTAYNAGKAIEGLAGAATALIEPLKEEVLRLLAEIEVNIDYPEYDGIGQLGKEELLAGIDKNLVIIGKIIEDSDRSLLLKEGILTVIIGEPNVGKSSLLNALLQQNRALVSEITGTTRDYIEGEAVIEDIHLRLIDTAGLRKSGDTLEKMGMEKTRELIDQAQLVIVVLDATATLSEQEKELITSLQGKNYLVVANKTDLNDEPKLGIKVSALYNDVGALVNAIKELYNTEELLNTETLDSQRQLGLLMQARDSLITAKEAITADRELELVAIDLHLCYQQLSDILGQYNKADLLECIFSNFCLGK